MSRPCCMLSRNVGSCWNRSDFWANNFQNSLVPWSPKRNATMLDSFAQLLQHCWGHAPALHMVSKVFWVVSFPRCTAGPNIVGSCCIHLPQHGHNNSQHCWANDVGSSCVCLHVALLFLTLQQQIHTFLAFNVVVTNKNKTFPVFSVIMATKYTSTRTIFES